MPYPKITELPETRYKTVREKDASGNRVSKQVPYTAYRSVKVVSNGSRFGHYLADGIIYSVIYWLLENAFNILVSLFTKDPISNVIVGLSVSSAFMLLFPAYYIFFEHFFQRTPGKFLTRTLVVDVYGNKPKIDVTILRNIIRMVPFEAFSCLSERGWHDKWSETFVITEKEYSELKELQKTHSQNTSIEDVLEDNSEALQNKKLRLLFVYVVFPLAIISQIAIIVYSFSKANEVFKEMQVQSVEMQIDSFEDIQKEYDAGNIEEAYKKILRFIEMRPYHSGARNLLGEIHFDKREYAKAYHAFQKAISLDKKNDRPHNNMSRFYYKSKQFKEAIREMMIADSLKPDESVYKANISKLYYVSGDVKNAIKYAEESFKVDSTGLDLWAEIAGYYHKTEQTDKRNYALHKVFDSADSANPNTVNKFFAKNPQKGYIIIMGTVNNKSSRDLIQDAHIEISGKKSGTITAITSGDGTYRFILPVDKPEVYTLKVSYPGFTSKNLVITTANIPAEKINSVASTIVSDFFIARKTEGVDYSVLNNPMRVYSYNAQTNDFMYNEKMHEDMLKKLEQIEKLEKASGK